MPSVAYLCLNVADDRCNQAAVRAGEYAKLDAGVPMLPLVAQSLGGLGILAHDDGHDFAAEPEGGLQSSLG